MAFELPQLPYSFDALEPHIDAQTMEIHHDRHHKAYVDNANAALEGTEWADKPVEQVLGDLELIPEEKRAAVRNNAGGHANHSLFWQIMSPDGGGDPSGDLAKAIDDTFGGVDALKSAVNDARHGKQHRGRTCPSPMPFVTCGRSGADGSRSRRSRARPGSTGAAAGARSGPSAPRS
jgi:Fe-Mn family superoxide dismutase